MRTEIGKSPHVRDSWAEELGFGVRQIQPASNPFAGALIAVRPPPLEILKETQ